MQCAKMPPETRTAFVAVFTCASACVRRVNGRSAKSVQAPICAVQVGPSGLFPSSRTRVSSVVWSEYLDFGPSRSTAAMKEDDTVTPRWVNPDSRRRDCSSKLGLSACTYVRPQSRRADSTIFTPRHDSSSSACRPNARSAALLHVAQLGVHRAQSIGCPDLGGFVRRDTAIRTRQFLCAMSLHRRRSFGPGRTP